ncbi:MAG: asparaginase [Ruminococcus sp.]|nr:asparaginase [Ruminococcus sp.]
MPRILWLSCGGTISCPNNKNSLSPKASEEQMVDMLEKISLSPDVDVTMRCVMNTDSSDMDITGLRRLAQAVYSGVKEEFSGIIVTHGTDTMAYTAAVLFHALGNTPPIIITGSQLPFYEKDSDGGENLSNAFKAACDRRFSGVYLLFGDKVIAGDRAVKSHITHKNAFTSRAGYGAVIRDGGFRDISPYRRTADVDPGECILREISDNVRLIKLTPFTSPDEIAQAASSLSGDSGGLILEGFGCGGIPGRLLGEIKKAADRDVRVVFVSQCLYGGTDGGRYEVGVKAAESGVIYGFALTVEGAIGKLIVKELPI